MRAAVWSLLSTDSELKTLGVEKVYAAPGMQSPTEKTYLILRWMDSTREFGMVSTQDLQVWAHSRDPDYNKLNKILARVKDLIVNTTHRQGSDGRLSQAYWQGDSADFRDDALNTYTRNSGFRCGGTNG